VTGYLLPREREAEKSLLFCVVIRKQVERVVSLKRERELRLDGLISTHTYIHVL
jgi:hypothetical protein